MLLKSPLYIELMNFSIKSDGNGYLSMAVTTATWVMRVLCHRPATADLGSHPSQVLIGT